MISPSLKTRLDKLYETFDAGYLSSDPVSVVKEFSDPKDQEITALIASSLAFGQVRQIIKACHVALELMGREPRHFVMTFRPGHEIPKWKKFYYRMVRPTDLLRLLFVFQKILKSHETLGMWVSEKYRESDDNLGQTWARCVEEIKTIDHKYWHWQKSKGRGFAHLLPDPLLNSASKRVNLLLRWMVRRDSVDLGLWNRLPPSKLLMPIDTHISRLAYNIGLTDRTDLSKKTAEEVTARLRQLDRFDPVKYDFALSRLGILSYCPRKKDKVKCAACGIQDICRL